MRSGPKAILYQSALFRTSELVWVKVAPLPVWRQVVRWLLILSGFLFFYVVAEAKDTFRNVEGLLGLLAWHVGYHMQSDVRIASSGDLQESYENRGGSGNSKTFGSWVEALSEGADEGKLKSSGYSYWFNFARIAWAQPCFLADWYPMVLAPVFLGYRTLIQHEWNLDKVMVLREFAFLEWKFSIGTVEMMCWAIAVLGLIAGLSSFAQGVELRACGGLTDRFRLNAAGRKAFFEQLAGLNDSAPSRAVEVPVVPMVEQPIVVPAAPVAAVEPPAPMTPVEVARPVVTPPAPEV